ncbi:MAG: hypothetical protein JWO09_1004 [Bacteroidetes bacterium]|nr:hypothetical protein [Bacteroidota bacterium]
MHLFQKNIFSENTPQFTRLESSSQNELAAVINRHYPRLTIREIAVAGAFEINSNNWKVVTDNGTYLFKRSDLSKLDALTAQSAITADLKAMGIPTLEFVPDSGGKIICSDGKHAYCLSVFQEGNYFGSSEEQWKELLTHLAALFQSCRTIDAGNFTGIPVRSFFTSEEDQLIDFLKTLPEIKQINKEQLAFVIAEHELLAQKKDPLPAPGIFHVDIHPHNLIFKENRLVLLTDFEAFQLTVPEISLGFGLYKCMRQLLAVCEESERDSAIRRVQKECETIFSSHTLYGLLQLGKADVIKRILHILKELTETGASRWLFALEIQLASLYEINAISRLLK